MNDFDLRPSLAEFLFSIANWRRRRYQDDLRDQRNLVSAQGLDDLAGLVKALPEDDPRLAILLQYASEGESFTPGQQTLYEIGRFRFFSADADLDAFLDRLAELAQIDHRERGNFGGKQVAGDEPW